MNAATPHRPAPPRSHGRRRLRRVRRPHGRHGLCRGAALQLVLPRHRLRRHARRSPTAAPGHVLDRQITVRFDANVTAACRGGSSRSRHSIEVRIGEVVTVNYTRHQQSARETVGQAAYNVAPPTVGAYFNKIKCFCFTEQRLAAGRDARDAGGVLRRSRRSPRMPSRTTSTPSRCPTPSIRAPAASRRGVERGEPATAPGRS